jgi:hypothetical protein
MIRKDNDFVRITLPKAFYGKGSIDHSIRRFNGVCKIDCIEKDGSFDVRFFGLDPEDLEVVSLEFANQALFFTKAGV